MSAQKVLFMVSANGVSHAGRMLLVARALRERFAGAIEFAGNGRYGHLLSEAGFPFHEMAGGFDHRRLRLLYTKWSIAELVAALRQFRPYLREVVQGELALYASLKPDVLVVDGRFTAPISAQVSGLPFIGVIHPQITPYSTLRLALPENFPLFARFPWLRSVAKLTPKVQERVAAWLWHRLLGFVLRYYNKLLADFNLPAFKDWDEVLRTLPAAVIFPDLELTGPTANLPPHCHYVGLLAWQPEMELPEPLRSLENIIYVTMGQTGNHRLIKPIIAGLTMLPDIQVVVTLGGRLDPQELGAIPPNVHVYDFLPGAEIAKRAKLMICHGTGATMAQALGQGVPVIGIPFTMPHEIGIDRVAALGAGVRISPDEVTPQRIASVVRAMLETPSYRAAATKLGAQLHLEDAPARAADVILSVLARPPAVDGVGKASPTCRIDRCPK